MQRVLLELRKELVSHLRHSSVHRQLTDSRSGIQR